MKRIFYLSIFLTLSFFLASACSDSTPAFKSITEFSILSVPPSANAPIYGEGPLQNDGADDSSQGPTGSEDGDDSQDGSNDGDQNENGSNDGDQNGSGSNDDEEETPPAEENNCDLTLDSITDFFATFDDLQYKKYVIQPITGSVLNLLSIGKVGNELHFQTKIFTFVTPGDKSSGIASYEFIEYEEGFDISNLTEDANIDKDACVIKLTNHMFAFYKWTEDDMEDDGSIKAGHEGGHPDCKSGELKINPKNNTTITFYKSNTKIFEAIPANAYGKLENKMIIP